MAWSRLETRDDGFATPAATLLSLALAMGVVAVVTASQAELKSARADLERTQLTNALAGGQIEAVVSLMGSSGGGILRWNETAAGRNLEVLAEPEALKTSITAVALMDDQTLAPFRLADPGRLKDRIKTLNIAQATGPDLDVSDQSPIWHECARSMISPFGLAEGLRPLVQVSLKTDAPSAHAGEIWRVRVKDPSGWADDRIVRLTGDSLRPAATLERHFSKVGQEEFRCDAYFNSAN